MKASLKRWIGRVPDVSAVMGRFPVPVVLMGIFTLIIILVDDIDADERFIYLLGGLVLAAYLMVSFTLSRETRNKDKALPIQIIGSGLICALAWFAKDIHFVLPAAIGGAILLLGNSVRHRRERDDLHVWDFTHKLWTGAVFAGVGSLIFLLGTLAIMAALKSLFGLDIKELAQDFILPLGLAFLAPLYWMSTLPAVDEPYTELHDNPGFVSKAVAFLGSWLLTPLLLIYAAILLAYGVKILMTGSLPKGEIAELTLPFIFIGTLNWLVLEPPFIQKNKLANLFRKIWFWLSVPVSILLGLAIAERVANYGLTEERIMLILCVIWALGIGLWFSFRKEKYRDIRYIPGFAAALLFFAAFTSSFFSLHNQDKRFVKYIKKAGIVSNGVVGTDITDMQAAKKAKGALGYMYRRDAEDRIEKHLKKWGAGFASLKAPDVYDALSLTDVETYSPRQQGLNWRDENQVIAVSGYDHITFELSFYGGNVADQKLFSFQDLDVTAKGLILTGQQDDTIIFTKDLKDIIQSYGTADGQYLVDDAEVILIDETDRKLLLRFRSLNQWGDSEPSGSFYLLSKGIKPKP